MRTLFPSARRTLQRVAWSLRGGLAPAPPHLDRLKLQYLHEVDIFQDLSPEEMHWLKESTRMVTCPAGQVIYDQNEPAEVLFILKRGRVQLYRLTPEGKKLEIDTLGPGTFFGEMPLLDQRMRQAYAEALEESLICILRRDDLERIILRKPQVALRILEVLSDRLAHTTARLEAMAFHSVAERLAAALLRMADGESVSATHQELAEAVGVYRETVTKVLAHFQHQGFVQLDRKRITLMDRGTLEDLAQAKAQPASPAAP